MPRKRASSPDSPGWTHGDGKPASVKQRARKKPRKRAAKKKTTKKKPGATTGTKFTQKARRDAILKAARKGVTIEGAARAGGIATSTLYEWLDKDREFSEALMEARSEAELRLVDLVEADDPKFLLERSYQYVKRMEITGKDGDPLRILASRLQDAANEED